MSAAKPRTLVYVAGPFSAKTREGVEANIIAAERTGLEVCRRGGMPVVPHANTALPEYETAQPYQFWIEGTAEMLLRCDAAFFMPNWRESSGARGERLLAEDRNIPIFDDLDALAAWLEKREA